MSQYLDAEQKDIAADVAHYISSAAGARARTPPIYSQAAGLALLHLQELSRDCDLLVSQLDAQEHFDGWLSLGVLAQVRCC